MASQDVDHPEKNATWKRSPLESRTLRTTLNPYSSRFWLRRSPLVHAIAENDIEEG